MRKTPRRHRVRSHLRKQKSVREYLRGKGLQNSSSKKVRIKLKKIATWHETEGRRIGAVTGKPMKAITLNDLSKQKREEIDEEIHEQFAKHVDKYKRERYWEAVDRWGLPVGMSRRPVRKIIRESFTKFGYKPTGALVQDYEEQLFG